MQTIVISHAAGRHFVECAAITFPRWESFCAKNGFQWQPRVLEQKVTDDRVAWQWEKLYAIAAVLRTGNRAVWVDADSFPTPWAPALIDNECDCPGEVMGIPICDPCPHACQPMSGIMYFEPSSLPYIESAMLDVGCKRQPYPEERAIFLALGFVARGLKFEPFKTQESRRLVRRLSMKWLCAVDDIDESSWGVHAYQAPQQKAIALHCASIAVDLIDARLNREGSCAP